MMRDMHSFGTPDLLDRVQPAQEGAPVAPGLDRTTSWEYPSRQALIAASDDAHPGRFYPRYGHPAGMLAEARIAHLEGAGGALVYGSGMAAISSVFLGVLGAGDRQALSRRCYGGTVTFARHDLPRWGVQVDFFDPFDAGELATALARGPRLVHVETPVNPTARALDLEPLCRAAHAKGALVSVDATFMPPPFQRTLSHGADYAIHSATKFLGGHTDILGGAVSGSVERISELERFRRRLGPTMAPDAAWLLARSLETVELRVRAQNAGAREVVHWLADRGKALGVARVHHPALPGHPDGVVAARQQGELLGSVFAFEVEGGMETATRVFDGLRRFRRGGSLGGVESLVSMPVDTSHKAYRDDDFARAGFSPSALRLSIGLEPASDLIADLEAALKGRGA
jgi:cystathionine beta-lyase/cystathionine gamma-synthase